MNKTAKISSIELALLAAGSALMFPYTFLPILRTAGNQDAWIVLLLAIPYIIVLNAPLLYLANKFRGCDFNDLNELILGKYVSKATLTVFLLFIFFCFISCMTISVNYVNMYFLQGTPRWALLIFMLVPLSFASMKGAGVIGRLATFIVPFIIITIIFFLFLGLDKIDLREITPILADSTFISLNKGAFLTAARFSEILIIVVFSFHLKTKSSINRAFSQGLVIFGISFMLLLLPTLLLLGSDFAKISNNPYFVYTRLVGGKDLFQRVQSINIMAWFLGSTIKLVIYNYMISYIVARLLKKPSHNTVVIPISVVGFIVALIPWVYKMDTIHLIGNDTVFPTIVFVVAFLIPLIMLFIYFARKKKIQPIIDEKRDAYYQSEKEGN